MNKYKTMHTRGGLIEAIQTQKPIDPDLAEYLIKKGIYKEYCYDERIKAKRYILKDHIEKCYKVPTWLLEFDGEEENA